MHPPLSNEHTNRSGMILLVILFSSCEGFITPLRSTSYNTLFQLPPEGSPWLRPEDAESEMPDTYEPMMEYPGTMRPGRTPENMPYHDLPLDIDSPDPIPWPHLQQIEWHHRWPPPHPHPIPMEVFIEMQGRWATEEDEADMRANTRRDIRERRDLEAQERKPTLIIDDDDEDDDAEIDPNLPVELGDGVFGSLGSRPVEIMDDVVIIDDDDDDDDEVTTLEKKSEDDDDDGLDDLDDFLLDLGLDSSPAKDLNNVDTTSSSAPPDDGTSKLLDAMMSINAEEDDDEEEDDDDDDDDDDDLDLGGLLSETSAEDDKEKVVKTTTTTTGDSDQNLNDEDAIAALSEDEDLDIDLDEDEDYSNYSNEDSGGSGGGMTTIPLEDFGDDSLLEDDDSFNDGGFDYDGNDDGGGGDGGDDW
eukprot:CAMPEP_0194166944 /NCGR_PEP_ID=MMETSP0154-20130528/2411_1 /TAXON_ID=1049557 /ORGANISM="Thalassiothrix antarctica, Strain L6-D1" /LENGTH=415 /DNA_ID=CAMNT_0038877759 /DNA_START=64 /DNA_END=1311 /DNA_ORIENTATION=+